ncbi:adenylate/guanylate cyclase domain-containing protein [Alteromonas halophila]|uniref:Guanylate cyclase domain-containing protein n=1 Tax=Alteromonas halophila TaxID=516698 RepID=A0A918JQ04_9ALTE|nr:adenylate/guanylate cyclase domain-containing protein [Alteromonas halophila]GGW89124.1 hypothetical protein GCM10007391_24160 [Alteromonas halophila]
MGRSQYADEHLTTQVRNTAGLLLIALALQLPVTLTTAPHPAIAGANILFHLFCIGLSVYLAHQHRALCLPRFILCLSFLSFLCCSVFIWRNDVYTQHFLLVGAMTSGFLFHRTEQALQYGWTLLFGLAFLTIEAMYIFPPDSAIGWVRFSNSVTLTLTTFAIVYTLGKMNIQRWRQVRATYEKTRAAMAKIVPEEPIPEIAACGVGDRIRLPQVCVLFADLAGFQKLSASYDDDALVSILDALYHEFDSLAHDAGVTRLKTNGDEYMAATGLSQRSPGTAEQQCMAMSTFAQALLQGFQRVAAQLTLPCHIRIGIACGPVTAGILGRQRPTLDIWGKTVNLASELEHTATLNSILIDQQMYNHVINNKLFLLRPRVVSTKTGPASAWCLTAALRYKTR